MKSATQDPDFDFFKKPWAIHTTPETFQAVNDWIYARTGKKLAFSGHQKVRYITNINRQGVVYDRPLWGGEGSQFHESCTVVVPSFAWAVVGYELHEPISPEEQELIKVRKDLEAITARMKQLEVKVNARKS